MRKLNRRDFLKLSLGLPAAAALAKLLPNGQAVSRPNVIIIVLDTMSAENLSLYGYHRQTTPSFERFAQRANVYHAHQSGGNFTVPGTGSLLSGMYPWTHRAINSPGFVARELVDRNLFKVVGRDYHRVAFSQNLWAVHLLDQFVDDIDIMLSPALFSTEQHTLGDKFTKDLNGAYLSFDEFLFWHNNPPPSLIFGIPFRARLAYKDIHVDDNAADYPAGLPSTGLLPLYFRLEELFAGLGSTIARLPAPYLAYFHLWGVHDPYAPQERFFNGFDADPWEPERKPRHRLGGRSSEDLQQRRRRRYDEYIASVDHEFGNLMDSLQAAGILDSSYVIVTADHGESLERGILGHSNLFLFQPLVHVPLMISSPGQQERLDIHTPTNSVDLLPTLAQIAGHEIPEWCEGEVLPGLGLSAVPDPERVSLSVESKGTPALGRMLKVTVAMRKGTYKMIYYRGNEYNFYELYDLEADPGELVDLYEKLPAVAKPMQAELDERFEAADQKYRHTSA